MPKFLLNKLVRDKLVDEYEKLGQKAEYKPLSRIEHLQALKQKIIEEAQEIPLESAKEKIIGELADVQQALDDLKVLTGISNKEIADVQAAKSAAKGGFLKGNFVTSLVLADDDEWVNYYRKESVIYKEIKTSIADAESKTILLLTPGVYQHYKGKRYEVLGVGRHSETGEDLVMYRPLYDHPGQPDLWVRPYNMFVGSVTINSEIVPRFKRILK